MTEIDVQINLNVPLDASVFPYQEGDGREIGTYARADRHPACPAPMLPII